MFKIDRYLCIITLIIFDGSQHANINILIKKHVSRQYDQVEVELFFSQNKIDFKRSNFFNYFIDETDSKSDAYKLYLNITILT